LLVDQKCACLAFDDAMVALRRFPAKNISILLVFLLLFGVAAFVASPGYAPSAAPWTGAKIRRNPVSSFSAIAL
jgi:hypothetical protein